MASERSEWGRLNAGQVYGILAVDVDRALACAGLGKYEQIVMQAVRERSWSSLRRKKPGEPWPDAEPARIDFAALAREMGLLHQRLYEARDSLLASRMLLIKDDGLMPNKNAHEWADPKTGKTRLTPGQIAYAARATTRRKTSATTPAFTPERECTDDLHSRHSVNCIHATA